MATTAFRPDLRSASAPPSSSRPDASLCTVCHERPRLGSLARCKVCLQEAAAAARQSCADAEARVKAREQPAATKRCKSCGLAKPLASFAPHKKSRDGHRHACKPCVMKGLASSPPRTEDQTRQAKERNGRPERRAKNRQAVKGWRLRNPSAGRARLALYRAKRKGLIAPPSSCQIAGCAEVRTVGHHHDYRRPLDVLHVCRRHHAQLHHGVALKLKPSVPARLKRLPRVEAPGAAPQTANLAMQAVA
jgi:hypothetical protein